MKNAVAWFEIPVADLARAKRFYETIFATSFQEIKIGESGPHLALFPVDYTQGAGGALAQGHGYTPTPEGSKVYLNAGDDLDSILQRTATAGGTVVVPKTQISLEFGYLAAFRDTEGNWVGLHARS